MSDCHKCYLKRKQNKGQRVKGSYLRRDDPRRPLWGRDQSEVSTWVIGTRGGRVLQWERTASAKVLGLQCPRCVQASTSRPMWQAKGGTGVELEGVARSELMQGQWAMIGTLDVFWVWWKHWGHKQRSDTFNFTFLRITLCAILPRVRHGRTC